MPAMNEKERLSSSSASHWRPLLLLLPRSFPAHHARAHARRAPGHTHSPSVMAIKYVLLVNKQGQTRLARYAVPLPPLAERVALEGEVVRKCLARSEKLV